MITMTETTTADDGDIAPHIAYDPTEGEIDAARDPDVHADHVTLDVSLGDVHKRVRERVEALVDAAHRSGVLQTIRVEPSEYDCYSVTMWIKPLEDWNVKGQRGFDSFHVTLGPQGGLRVGTRNPLFTETREYDSWDSLRRAVKRAD